MCEFRSWGGGGGGVSGQRETPPVVRNISTTWSGLIVALHAQAFYMLVGVCLTGMIPQGLEF